MSKTIKESMPIVAISGVEFNRLFGICAIEEKRLPGSGVAPNMTWTCRAIMLIPIAASIPCTTGAGKNALRLPSL
ncbi:hypothetical protein BMETH_603_1 [methanotrophic bacterial endosymbiont of Bathymodiolus sp.]|nr:hypothetical protein BMETH_603_1 [methanotrophic bacterial endosymbiont of Bathymodiolus sp.]